MPMHLDVLMQNEANSGPSRAERGVLTGQRASTRCRRNRDKQSGSLVRGQKRLVSSRWSKEEGAGDARNVQNEANGKLAINYLSERS